MFCQKNWNLRTKRIAPLFLENSTLNTNFDQKQKVFFVLPFIALLWSNWQGIGERCDGLAIGKRTHHRVPMRVSQETKFTSVLAIISSCNIIFSQDVIAVRHLTSSTVWHQICQSLLIKRHWELLFQWWIKMFGSDIMWFVQP